MPRPQAATSHAAAPGGGSEWVHAKDEKPKRGLRCGAAHEIIANGTDLLALADVGVLASSALAMVHESHTPTGFATLKA